MLDLHILAVLDLHNPADIDHCFPVVHIVDDHHKSVDHIVVSAAVRFGHAADIAAPAAAGRHMSDTHNFGHSMRHLVGCSLVAYFHP